MNSNLDNVCHHQKTKVLNTATRFFQEVYTSCTTYLEYVLNHRAPRLELQHGLSESNDSVDRDDLRHKIDTDDVILRWWNVGMITYYFPQLDRLPITNVVWGIRKKAVFANRIASVKTMQD